MRQFFIVLVLLVLLGGLSYGGYRYYNLNTELQNAKQDEATLAAHLAEASSTADMLEQALISEQTKSANLADQVGTITNTVGTLTKLTQTDPELLQKYSKVYFLSDNYVPRKLAYVDPSFVFGTKSLQFEDNSYPDLKNLMGEAAQSGIDLKIISAYRSFGTQAELKSNYKVTYGSGANAFSADQGYSEHQLGTAIDFTTSKLGDNFDTFAATPAYAWLQDNAYRFGFILSYPKGNTYYKFEPWHWRFVGKNLARDLRSQGKNFYDLDQRTIDTYLVTLFN